MQEPSGEELGLMVLEYLFEQKMLGRVQVSESEVHDALGFPWDDNFEDRIFELSEEGETFVTLEGYKQRKSFL
jgi:hypothetical protein